MSDKPNHSQKDSGEDIIKQVISEGLSGNPPQEDPPAPEQKPEEASPPEVKKNKRSATYIYLLILFGAAFFMLLLAYFVQQRNNEFAMSDLRNSMNLSREELVEQIELLEGEKEQLQKDVEGLQAQADALQQQLDEQTDQNFWLERELEDQALSWKAIYDLEEDFRTEDYDGCVLFFDNTLHAIHIYTPPEAAPRVEEIYRELVQMGILNEEDYPLSAILGTPANQ